MSEGSWQKVRRIELTGKLIEREETSRPADLVAEATDVEVRLADGFAHISMKVGDLEVVTVVPASSVKRLTYERKRSSPQVAFR